ncbi:IS3 family transposase [Flammeovirga kamogawensis]|uniref:IS3 family transposase n=2 Tax=Flammeovirga kamogawensis TaxID=373891 RepID=A0ABX8H0L5_9BACT|nr:IS3 family transposase [Flammeovirga kamogawensis]QWG09430.1 IS3 family transposase [Flammeovirga kamogawensis]
MLGLNRQIYYRSKRKVKNNNSIASKVVDLVKRIRLKQTKIGTRKLYQLLLPELQLLNVGRDKLFDIMRANRLDIKPKKQYHVTTNSHHRFKKHKNLIEHLEINRPEQVLVSDITYIGERSNPMYLSLVTDAYSKKIMGLNVSDSLNANGAIAALKEALKNRNYVDLPMIHHSDRGLQYCSHEYQRHLQENKVLCSMTESYDPYQNAVAERINGILKQEFILGIKINDLDLMNKFIRESVYIYNNERPHWSNYMKTPVEMHQQSEIKMRTYKSKNSTESTLDAINI